MLNEKFVKSIIKKSHKYTFDAKLYIHVDEVKDLLLNVMYQQRKACAESAKPFLQQHIVLQELRDLYTTKIINSEVDDDKRT